MKKIIKTKKKVLIHSNFVRPNLKGKDPEAAINYQLKVAMPIKLEMEHSVLILILAVMNLKKRKKSL